VNFDIGTKRILYIELTGTYFPVGCLTDNSFSESAATLDTTVRTNVDGWGSVVMTRQNYNISFSGLLTLDNAGGSIITYRDIETLKRLRIKISWRIFSTLGGETEEGSGYITSISNSSAIDDFVSFSGEITGTGMPVTISTPPPIDKKWIEIDDAWVYKGTNIDKFQIEPGDMIRRYPITNRYIHARVNTLPYTNESNLSIFEDITII